MVENSAPAESTAKNPIVWSNTSTSTNSDLPPRSCRPRRSSSASRAARLIVLRDMTPTIPRIFCGRNGFISQRPGKAWPERRTRSPRPSPPLPDPSRRAVNGPRTFPRQTDGSGPTIIFSQAFPPAWSGTPRFGVFCPETPLSGKSFAEVSKNRTLFDPPQPAARRHRPRNVSILLGDPGI